MRTSNRSWTCLALLLAAASAPASGCIRPYDFPPFNTPGADGATQDNVVNPMPDAVDPGMDATVPPDEPVAMMDTPPPPPDTSVDAPQPVDNVVVPDVRDTGPTCSATPCRLLAPQCGCAAGQVCSLDPAAPASAERGRCVTTRNLPGGSRCTTDGDCVAGFDCIGGICRPFCLQSSPECAANSYCGAITTTGGMTPTIGVCIGEPCILPTNSGCMTGTACEVVNRPGTETLITVCVPAGTVPYRNVCTATSRCAPTFSCLPTTTPGTSGCFRFCRVAMGNVDCAGDPAAAGDVNCRGFSPAEVINGIEYGTCAP